MIRLAVMMTVNQTIAILNHCQSSLVSGYGPPARLQAWQAWQAGTAAGHEKGPGLLLAPADL